MYENERREKMLDLMGAIESFDRAINAADAFLNLDFEDLSRNHWREIQGFVKMSREILEMTKNQSSNAVKLLDNPALYDHYRAVMDSED